MNKGALATIVNLRPDFFYPEKIAGRAFSNASKAPICLFDGTHQLFVSVRYKTDKSRSNFAST